MTMNTLIGKVLKVEGMALVQVNGRGMGRLQEALTLHSTGERMFCVELFRSGPSPKQLWIPRALVTRLTSLRPSGGKAFTKELKTSFKLRPEQVPLVQNYMKTITYGPNYYGGIIRAPTGTGKTVLAMDILKRLQLKTLIIVPTSRLLNQWQEELIKHTNLLPADIGVIRQNKCDVQGKQVCVGMLHSLAKDKYPEWVKAEFGLVVFDEVHTLATETFSIVAPMFNSKYRLSLSATPRRKDGMANVFLYHLGPIVANKTTHDIQPKVVVLPYKGPEVSHRACFWNGKLNLGKYFNLLTTSRKRTRFIAQIILKLYREGKQDLLVLSDRLQILEDLATMLKSSEIPEANVGLFTGDTKQLDRKILLGTYGSAGLGADIPRLSALVLATPRADVEQAVGRLLRGEGTPMVIDVVDMASRIMIGWSLARQKFYRTITKDIINKC